MPFTLSPATEFDVDVEDTSYLDDRKDAPERWVLNLGPQHPATHTTLRVVLELDGERVSRATPHIGYLHSGFEKLGEHHDWNQYVCTISRMDYISPIVNDIAWHTAVESCSTSIAHHAANQFARSCASWGVSKTTCCVLAAALDLGGITSFIYGFNEREFVYDILDFVSGQRFHPDYTRVGGLKNDLPCEETFKTMVKDFIHKRLPKAVGDLETMLNRNRIFIDRLQGVGVMTKEEAIDWGLSGPLARASGVRRDLRKDRPYLCYADNWDGQGAPAVEFDVPIATTGDCYARYLVRIEEIKQSVRIIEQLIDTIPSGSVNASPEGKGTLPEKGQVYGSIEATIQQFELVMRNRGFDAHRRGLRIHRRSQRRTGLLPRR